MAKDQKFGITRNFAKHLIRGGVKSIPLAGNLFDEIIFGTLEGETAQKESKKLHAKLDEIVKQIDTQEGDFAEILAGLHLQTDFNEDVRKEFAKIEQLLRDPENAPVPESFNSAFEKLAADHDWQDEKLNRIDAKVTAIFDKMLDEAGSGSGRRKKRTVRIVIPNVEFNDFDERNKTLLEHGLANFLRIEPGDISVTEVEPGSVKVTVEIPDEHVRKLVKAVSIGDSNLTDTLEPFNLKVRQVFISYNHENEDWKNKLVRHLGVLEKEGLVEVWDDRKIGAGDVWSKKIEGAINSANVAILMITAEFLTSDFILSKEVPMLLERMQKEGLRVIPLIVKPCAWKKVKWLKVIQSRPKDGKALSGMSDHEIDEALTELAEEIHRLVSKDQGRDRTERTRGRKQDFFIPKVLPAKCPPSVKHLGEKEPEVEMAEISIAIKGKYRPLSPEAMSEIISTFSKEMGGVVGEIRVLYTMPGRSMRITMAVPREYAERVRSLCTEKSPTLKKLGVKGVEVRTIASVVKVAFPKYWPTPEAFVGRERELASLDDAWGGECDVFMLVAWGGVGKTALVNEWMNRMAEGNWHGARRVYGWSFYSQGTKERVTSRAMMLLMCGLMMRTPVLYLIMTRTGQQTLIVRYS